MVTLERKRNPVTTPQAVITQGPQKDCGMGLGLSSKQETGIPKQPWSGRGSAHYTSIVLTPASAAR